MVNHFQMTSESHSKDDTNFNYIKSYSFPLLNNYFLTFPTEDSFHVLKTVPPAPDPVEKLPQCLAILRASSQQLNLGTLS